MASGLWNDGAQLRGGVCWLLGALLAASLAAAACSSPSRSFSACGESCGPNGGGEGGAEAGGGTDNPRGGNPATPDGGEPPAAGGVAGAAGSSEVEGGFGGKPSEPDDEPPTVVSVVPEVGAVGVSNDPLIEITFSEAMNKVAAQAAFQSANLGGVTFEWPSNDVLRVIPNAKLEYQAGSSLAVVAKTYGFSIGALAEDTAGNSLENAFSSEFTTLREITAVAPRVDKYYEYDDGTVRTLVHASEQDSIRVGDLYYVPQSNNEWIRGLLVFDIGTLPLGIQSFASATLSVVVCCPVGNPVSLGGIQVHHIHMDTVTDAMTSVAPLSSAGQLTDNPSAGSKSMAVKAVIEDAYAQRLSRANQLQLRFQFDPATDDDEVSDYVELDSSAGAPAQISVVYLIP